MPSLVLLRWTARDVGWAVGGVLGQKHLKEGSCWPFREPLPCDRMREHSSASLKQQRCSLASCFCLFFGGGLISFHGTLTAKYFSDHNSGSDLHQPVVSDIRRLTSHQTMAAMVPHHPPLIPAKNERKINPHFFSCPHRYDFIHTKNTLCQFLLKFWSKNRLRRSPCNHRGFGGWLHRNL